MLLFFFEEKKYIAKGTTARLHGRALKNKISYILKIILRYEMKEIIGSWCWLMAVFDLPFRAKVFCTPTAVMKGLFYTIISFCEDEFDSLECKRLADKKLWEAIIQNFSEEEILDECEKQGKNRPDKILLPTYLEDFKRFLKNIPNTMPVMEFVGMVREHIFSDLKRDNYSEGVRTFLEALLPYLERKYVSLAEEYSRKFVEYLREIMESTYHRILRESLRILYDDVGIKNLSVDIICGISKEDYFEVVFAPFPEEGCGISIGTAFPETSIAVIWMKHFYEDKKSVMEFILTVLHEIIHNAIYGVIPKLKDNRRLKNDIQYFLFDHSDGFEELSCDVISMGAIINAVKSLDILDNEEIKKSLESLIKRLEDKWRKNVWSSIIEQDFLYRLDRYRCLWEAWLALSGKSDISLEELASILKRYLKK